MSFDLVYHPDVKAVDIPLLNETLKRRIKKAIEERLKIAPQEYGEPLRKTLKGYWKMRVGDYRIIFDMENDTLTILKVGHRKYIYR